MTQRALITGAAGFVGQRLSRHLKELGWEVVSTDFQGKVDYHADLCDNTAVRQLLDQVGPVTHVFHLAAMAFVPDAGKDPAGAMDINLLGTIRLATALQDLGTVPRLIFIGSADAYGPPQFLPIIEEHPLKPQNPYAISKAAADQYCQYLSKSSDLEIIRVRPFNHSGPGQSDRFVLSSFARQIAAATLHPDAATIKVGNLEAARDFAHVDDILRGYAALAIDGIPGHAYNLCSAKAQTIDHALDTLLSFTEVPIKVEQDPERMRPVDVPLVEGCYEKAQQDTGWEPKITFETLLHELYDYWLETLQQEVGVQA